MELFSRRNMSVFPIFLLVILPNILFVLASLLFELGRPWVNLDYLFVTVLFALNHRLIASLFLVLAITADTLALIGQVYPFIRINDLVYLSKFVFIASGKIQIFVFSSLISIFIVFYGFIKLIRKEDKLRSLIFFNIAIVFYLFNVYGKEGDRNRFWRVTDRPVVSSQLVSFYNYRWRGFIETFHLKGEAFSQVGFRGATEHWGASPDNLSHKLLLIVNESWGVSNSKAAQAAIVRPIIQSKDRFDIKTFDEMPFVGATVAGELRELCGLRPNHFNLAPVIDGYETCLPKRFVELGYSTHAIHGAVGLMYDRHLWYPRVGFQDMIFFETKPWPTRCYSFPGACDIDLAEEVRNKLMEEGKSFVYWLTLNTHNFYDPRDIKMNVFDCKEFDIDYDTETCRSMKLQAQFFFSLSEMLSGHGFSGMEVIVVGDHTPPIFNAVEKEKYFKESAVSFINFTVK